MVIRLGLWYDWAGSSIVKILNNRSIKNTTWCSNITAHERLTHHWRVGKHLLILNPLDAPQGLKIHMLRAISEIVQMQNLITGLLAVWALYLGFVLFPQTIGTSRRFLRRKHEALSFLVLVCRGVKRPRIQEEWIVTHGRLFLVLYLVNRYISVKCGVLVIFSLRWTHLAWIHGTLT